MAKGKKRPQREHSPDTARFWKEDPETIRRFFERAPHYEQLGSEVAYILKRRLEKDDIEVSAVTFRAKTLKSFLEKLSRKHYSDPFDDITDFAGVRVVCLYLDDIALVEEIIADEFKVVEKVDKLNEREPDQFGYGAIHYIVKLGSKSSGARYDDLREYVCEIQVRTVLQDAWAIIDHHMVYKRESSVPKVLLRKLNSLTGLFEIADDHFQRIRDEREEYVEKIVKSQKTSESFLSNEVNLDSLRQYLLWKFPDEPVEVANSGQLSHVLEFYVRATNQTLAEIDEVVNAESERVETVLEKARSKLQQEDGKIPSCTNLAVSFVLSDPRKMKIVDRPIYEAIIEVLRS